MEIDVNNISTMASMIWGVIVYPILMAIGIEINQGLGTAIIGAIILLALLIWSAMNPNKLAAFGNAEPTPVNDDHDAPVVNDEYVTGDDNDGC